MKRNFIIALVAFNIAACTNTSTHNKQNAADTNENTARIMCFQKLEGKSNQDTSYVRLYIDGAQVSGEFSSMPFEKDSRKGSIQAIKDKDLIKGIWIFRQEGITDSLDVEFRLTEDKLVQKNYTIDPKTGREVFSEGSMFNIEFQKVDCSE